MVNMQGAGDAYARRYIQNNTFMPQHIKTRPAPQHKEFFGGHEHCETTVNYKFQMGPGGFLGGVLGLLNGFMSTQNLFNTGNYWNLTPTPQAQAGAPAGGDKLANLKTLYPKFNIVSEGNGKYSATDADGKLIGQNLSYEDMCKALAAKQESNGVDNSKDKANNDKDKTDNDKDKVDNDKDKADNDKKYGTAASADEFGKYSGAFTVHDEVRGQKGDLSRNSFKASSKKDKSGFPTSINVGGYQYAFQGVDSDGAALYKSQNGAGDIYRLEKNSDGQFALNQYEGMFGAGSIDISNAKRQISNVTGGSDRTDNKTKTLKDGTTLTTLDNGNIKVHIPTPLKDAGEITLDGDSVKGLTPEKIRESAAELIIKEQSKPELPKFEFS